MRNDIVILIPVYEPDRVRFPALVQELRGLFAHIVVVDDGSVSGKDVLATPSGRFDVVLTHPANRGKGAALKTGFAWILDHLPDVKGVVTVDADGQHLPKDVEAVAVETANARDGLVLGVRAFSGDVPFRSRFGNGWARVLFRLLTGLAIRDTQTGLRGIPVGLLPRMLEIPGERYEYEIRMLVDACHHRTPPLQIPIETVYLENNASSHFRPLRDTVLTQRALWGALFRKKGGAERLSHVRTS